MLSSHEIADIAALPLGRGLARTEPQAVRIGHNCDRDFLPDLASSLNNLGIRLSDLGRRVAALAASQEAVDIRRALAKDRPDSWPSSSSMSGP